MIIQKNMSFFNLVLISLLFSLSSYQACAIPKNVCQLGLFVESLIDLREPFLRTTIRPIERKLRLISDDSIQLTKTYINPSLKINYRLRGISNDVEVRDQLLRTSKVNQYAITFSTKYKTSIRKFSTSIGWSDGDFSSKSEKKFLGRFKNWWFGIGGIGGLIGGIALFNEYYYYLPKWVQDEIEERVKQIKNCEIERKKYNNFSFENLSDKTGMMPRKVSLHYRIKSLKDIENTIRLADENYSRRSISCIIVGPPGVGKSKISEKYALDNSHNYHVVWIFDKDNVEEQFEKFASRWNEHIKKWNETSIKKLNSIKIVEEKPQEIERVEEKYKRTSRHVLEALKDQNLSYLIIFDNINSFNELENFVPFYQQEKRNFYDFWRQKKHFKNKHVIITSKNRQWGDHNDAIFQLGGFSPDEAEKFLTGVRPEEECSKLAQQLKYYPLALMQAASVLRERQTISVDDYLNEFERSPKEFLNQDVNDEYKRTIMGTFNIVFDTIKETYPRALDFLTFLSLLNSENIPNTLIKKIYEVLKKKNPLDLDKDILNPLERHSLISVTAHQTDQTREIFVSTHEMVQFVVRERNFNKDTDKGKNIKRKIIKQLIDLILAEIDPNCTSLTQIKVPDQSKVPLFYTLSPHVEKLLVNHTLDIKIDDYERLFFLGGSMAAFLGNEGLYDRSTLLLERLLDLAKEINVKKSIIQDLCYYVISNYIEKQDVNCIDDAMAKYSYSPNLLQKVKINHAKLIKNMEKTTRIKISKDQFEAKILKEQFFSLFDLMSDERIAEELLLHINNPGNIFANDKNMALAFFYKHKGFVQLHEDNNPEKAEESYRKARIFYKEYYRTSSNETENRDLAWNLYDIGISLIKQEKYDEGLKKLYNAEHCFKRLCRSKALRKVRDEIKFSIMEKSLKYLYFSFSI